MPRLKSGTSPPQKGAERWLLNQRLFGDLSQGGHQRVPLPEALPLDWTEVFGREAPLVLEIGFNRGKFLCALAERWPGHNCVGIELRRRYPWLLAERFLKEGGPENLKIIWGDAKLLSPALFPPGSLSQLLITFPDPWWKKRHFKRRLISFEFAQRIQEQLQPGGLVWVKSDVPAIAEEIREALAEAGLEGPEPFAQEALPLTHRERRCIEQGLPIERFYFRRSLNLS